MKSLNQNQYTLKPKDLNEENETEPKTITSSVGHKRL